MYAAKDAGAVGGLSSFDKRRGSVPARSVAIDGLAARNIGEAGPSKRKGSDAMALTDGAVAVSETVGAASKDYVAVAVPDGDQ